MPVVISQRKLCPLGVLLRTAELFLVVIITGVGVLASCSRVPEMVHILQCSEQSSTWGNGVYKMPTALLLRSTKVSPLSIDVYGVPIYEGKNAKDFGAAGCALLWPSLPGSSLSLPVPFVTYEHFLRQRQDGPRHLGRGPFPKRPCPSCPCATELGIPSHVDRKSLKTCKNAPSFVRYVSLTFSLLSQCLKRYLCFLSINHLAINIRPSPKLHPCDDLSI